MRGSVINGVLRRVGTDRRARDLDGAGRRAVVAERAAAGPAHVPLASAPAGRMAARGRRPAAPRGRCSRTANAGFGLSSVLLLFLLLVVVVAAVGGLLPAILAARQWIAARELLLHAADPHVHDRGGREPARPLRVPRRRRCRQLVGEHRQPADRRRRPRASRGRDAGRARGTLVTAEDPLPQLVAQLRAAFAAESVAVLRELDDGEWEVEAVAGEPVPSRPDDAIVRGARSARSSSWSWSGPRSRTKICEVLRAFAAQVAGGRRAASAPGGRRSRDRCWPRATSCAPRCSPRCRTTCARRSRRSRRR